MQIDNSSINMASAHSLSEKYEKSEELRIWVDKSIPQKDNVTLTEEAKKQSINEQTNNLILTEEARIDELSPATSGRLYLLKMLVETLTGEKIDIKEISTYNSDTALDEIIADQKTINPENQLPEREGWGIVYNSTESIHEKEDLSFNAEGVIRTKDGKEIEISLQLEMNREFKSEETVSFRAGDALIDPLVINFSGPAAGLTASKFSFDLDVDGKEENISFVNQGSGLLALDSNIDGIINNGSELFGPQSGNGFQELAVYDEDGNSWIDENDSVYGRLKIWTKDTEGNDYLNTLKEMNVGAIYLNSLDTEFSLKDSQNRLNGQLAKTGIYLREDGSAGTAQQINLVA